MDVATVVDILFLHIFLTGKTGKVDMFNILITMQQFHICCIYLSVLNIILIIYLSLPFIILCKVQEKIL